MTWRTLSDLLANPELLIGPEPVIPHLAWKARLTLIAAAPKFGKSTLVRQGCAAKVTGNLFLGEPVTLGLVGMLCLDEPLSDLVRNL